MKQYLIYALLVGTPILQYCSPTIATKISAVYDENLSKYRTNYNLPKPKDTTTTFQDATTVTVIPRHSIKQELDTVIYRIIASKQHIKYINGYTVQLYAGNSRDKANAIKTEMYPLLDKFKPKISYHQPNYKVRVGEYYSRIEANADLVMLQKHFSRAVLVPVKIKIR